MSGDQPETKDQCGTMAPQFGPSTEQVTMGLLQSLDTTNQLVNRIARFESTTDQLKRHTSFLDIQRKNLLEKVADLTESHKKKFDQVVALEEELEELKGSNGPSAIALRVLTFFEENKNLFRPIVVAPEEFADSIHEGMKKIRMQYVDRLNMIDGAQATILGELKAIRDGISDAEGEPER